MVLLHEFDDNVAVGPQL